MGEQKIEVGDVFVHDSRPAVELMATHVDEHGFIKGSDELWHSPKNCILIRKADRPISQQLQPGCKWVKANWALQPTDFMCLSGHQVTAEQQGRAWSIALTNHTWQRPQLLDTDLLYTMKCIKAAANALPESDKQRYIFEMLQVQSQAGKLLSEIRDRAEAAAKAAAELKATEGGQP